MFSYHQVYYLFNSQAKDEWHFIAMSVWNNVDNIRRLFILMLSLWDNIDIWYTTFVLRLLFWPYITTITLDIYNEIMLIGSITHFSKKKIKKV